MREQDQSESLKASPNASVQPLTIWIWLSFFRSSESKTTRRNSIYIWSFYKPLKQNSKFEDRALNTATFCSVFKPSIKVTAFFLQEAPHWKSNFAPMKKRKQKLSSEHGSLALSVSAIRHGYQDKERSSRGGEKKGCMHLRSYLKACLHMEKHSTS